MTGHTTWTYSWLIRTVCLYLVTPLRLLRLIATITLQTTFPDLPRFTTLLTVTLLIVTRLPWLD